MFRKLFQRRPRLDAADPDDRAAAVAALADDDQATFARVFQDDGDRQVRLAALARLTDPKPMLTGLADAEVAEAATRRLLAIADEHTPVAIREHPDLLRAALAYAQDKEAAVAAAASIADVETRAAALADNARAEVRRAAAEDAWAPDFLAELAKCMRGRDKLVHRLASERLAVFKQASAERCREDAETDRIAAAAEALADDDPHYEARRDTLDRNWQQHLRTLATTDQQLAPFGVVARDLNAIRGRFPVRRQPPKAALVNASENYQPLLAEAQTLAEEIAAEMASKSLAESLPGLTAKADALGDAWRSEAEAAAVAGLCAGGRSLVTSSVGRLFDAVAVLCGLADSVSYDGQAAVRLEQAAAVSGRSYRWGLPDPSRGVPMRIDPALVIAAVAEDAMAGVDPAVIAGAFHTGLAEMIVEVCERLRDAAGVGTAALSGGVFQNRLLVELAVHLLEAAGFEVLLHSQVPPNDGGISLGQVAVGRALLRAR